MNEATPPKLMPHTFAIEDAPKAYELITGKTQERFVGVLLKYPSGEGRGANRPDRDSLAGSPSAARLWRSA